MLKRLTGSRFVLLVLVLGLFATACGDADGGSAATDAGTTATEGADTGGAETASGQDDAAVADGEPVNIGLVASFSGSGALAGGKFRAGIEMAAEEIEATGGIVGRPINLIVEDARTEPNASVAAMRRVLGQDPIAMLGTVFSGLTVVNMDTVAQAGIPQFTASEAQNIFEKGATHIFATSHTAGIVAERSRDLIAAEFDPQSVAIVHANTEFGVANADAIRALFEELGVEIIEDLSVDNEATDFSGAVDRIRRAEPDMIYLIMHEESGGRIMLDIERAGLEGPDILGNVVMLSGDVRELAGAAADGIYGLVGEIETADAMRDVGERFAAATPGELPDNNLYKGYIAMHTVAAVYNEMGEIDPEAFQTYLHGRTLCVEDHPGILLSTHWDEDGNIDRQMYIVQIQEGVPEVSQILPPRNPENFEECERME